MVNPKPACLKVQVDLGELDWEDVAEKVMLYGSHDLRLPMKLYSPSGELLDVLYPQITVTDRDTD